ncbi:DUF485 domain-containing protein [Actinocorallia sp. A-T 12471]|uniref:DUF485 domain-containing protein n=1 Tax=Actinocorallia sp. A-T 12471 TaxID=3089813 RepID=UPI0029D08550|nr:DUF485 domain-containing protein [Actinocorallia sp. A-T 12471]MDX6741921.1 DUF485 domain-containing protein [Actinocorallia sp. A-T 12471]
MAAATVRPGAERMGGECAVIAGDRKFRLLRARFQRLVIRFVGVFLGWYLLYIGLSAFARGFMAQSVVGHVNVALVLGVLQFASTFGLAWYYSRYARRMLDPLAAQLRAESEHRVRTALWRPAEAPPQPPIDRRVAGRGVPSGGRP